MELVSGFSIECTVELSEGEEAHCPFVLGVGLGWFKKRKKNCKPNCQGCGDAEWAAGCSGAAGRCA
jgi:hypothetical protein